MFFRYKNIFKVAASATIIRFCKMLIKFMYF
jgi:hypothetical protein